MKGIIMIVAYEIPIKADSLPIKLGEKGINLYEVYIKLRDREYLHYFMSSKEKNDLENNFYMGHPFPITIMDGNLNKLYTIHVNNKNIQFITTEKVNFVDEI